MLRKAMQLALPGRVTMKASGMGRNKPRDWQIVTTVCGATSKAKHSEFVFSSSVTIYVLTDKLPSDSCPANLPSKVRSRLYL